MAETLLVATKKGLFTVKRGRDKRWAVARSQFLGDHLSLVCVDPRGLGVWFAAFEHGHFGPKLMRSRDEGKNWEEIAKPTYPEKPAGEVDKDPFRGTDIPWSVKRIWAMEPATPDTPGRLWLGTIPGGLFLSDDGGDSWTLVRSLWDHPDRKKWTGGGADMAGIHSICVDPRDDKHVTVGVSCGGAWITRDGGQTWKVGGKGMKARYMPEDQQDDPVGQDPHILVQCAAKPDVMWVQHHCGIFRSTDGAASWQEIEKAGPSTFGFAVAAHPQQPDTAWFVPAQKDEHRIPVDGKLVVTRTRDGGKSFDVLTQGLPQTQAWDLVYRHGLAIDETGDTLAFGSTTGSLYVTNNGGDEWQCVSEHLPPIDSVRFAFTA